MTSDSPTQEFLQRWNLASAGESFETPTSWLEPVSLGSERAMLKVYKPTSDEHGAAELLSWYGGDGAVRVLRSDHAAILLEWAGTQDLAMVPGTAADDEAAEILAQVVSRLLEPRTTMPPRSLTPLDQNFRALFEREGQSDTLYRCAEVARQLLATQTDRVPLHGDIHHRNVLLSDRGWLAFDPKSLIGDPAYEVANLLRNPSSNSAVVHDRYRFDRLSEFYANVLKLDVGRVRAFAFAHAGLSAAWDLEDGLDPTFSLTCADYFSSV